MAENSKEKEKKAGEDYQLKEGVTIFYDDESELKVIGGEKVTLDEDNVTAKTAAAMLSGALVKVRMPKAGKETDK